MPTWLMPIWLQTPPFARCVERVYDVCLVRAPQKSVGRLVVRGRPHRVGDCVFRIRRSGPRQPYRPHGPELGPAQDPAGDHDAVGVCALRRALHERDPGLGLSPGRALHGRGGLLYLSGEITISGGGHLYAQFPELLRIQTVGRAQPGFGIIPGPIITTDNAGLRCQLRLLPVERNSCPKPAQNNGGYGSLRRFRPDSFVLRCRSRNSVRDWWLAGRPCL